MAWVEAPGAPALASDNMSDREAISAKPSARADGVGTGAGARGWRAPAWCCGARGGEQEEDLLLLHSIVARLGLCQAHGERRHVRLPASSRSSSRTSSMRRELSGSGLM